MIGIDFETENRKALLAQKLETPTWQQWCWYAFIFACCLLLSSYMPVKDEQAQTAIEQDASARASLYSSIHDEPEREEIHGYWVDMQWAELQEKSRKLKGRK